MNKATIRRLTSRRSQPPLALAVPLSRFTSRVGGGSAFYVRHHRNTLMKNLILVIALLLGSHLQSVLAASTNENARFVAEARAAFTKHDINRLMALYCWDGVGEDLKAATRAENSKYIGRTFLEITLTGPNPEWTVREWKRGGDTYVVNLPLTKNLNVKLKPLKGSGPGVEYQLKPYNVGEKDGKLYLLSAAPVK